MSKQKYFEHKSFWLPGEKRKFGDGLKHFLKYFMLVCHWNQVGKLGALWLHQSILSRWVTRKVCQQSKQKINIWTSVFTNGKYILDCLLRCTLQWKIFRTNHFSDRVRLVSAMDLSTSLFRNLVLFAVTGWGFIRFKVKLCTLRTTCPVRKPTVIYCVGKVPSRLCALRSRTVYSRREEEGREETGLNDPDGTSTPWVPGRSGLKLIQPYLKWFHFTVCKWHSLKLIRKQEKRKRHQGTFLGKQLH